MTAILLNFHLVLLFLLFAQTVGSSESVDAAASGTYYKQYLRWQSLSTFDAESLLEYHKGAHKCNIMKENLERIFWCAESMHNKIVRMSEMNNRPHWNRTIYKEHPRGQPNCR